MYLGKAKLNKQGRDVFLQNTLFTALSCETQQHMELQSICSCCNALRIAVGFEWCEGMENSGRGDREKKKNGSS